MADNKPLIVPDIGSSSAVDVIEILVSPGDEIQKDDSLITLESDKATMEVPASEAGVVASLAVKVGDKVNTGDTILFLESGDAPLAQSDADKKAEPEKSPEPKAAAPAKSASQELVFPDLGTDADVDVIEILVSVGDEVTKDDAVITLEGDKATMDVPVSASGTIESIAVKVGDKVKTGSAMLTLASSGEALSAEPVAETAPKAEPVAEAKSAPAPAQAPAPAAAPAANGSVYAGPAVRRLAREFGVDLSQVRGSGRKGRIVAQDVKDYVKARLAQPAGGGLAVAAAPQIDFSQFGEIETQPLNKIKRLTGENVHRSWVTVPHVTQFDEADITEMEAFRKANKAKAEQQGVKLTPLVFIMKAVVACLKQFPSFNASLDSTAENLILKKYFNIGVAVDTPNGLVVPVIRDVDKKGFLELAKELAEVSVKARDKKLMPKDMSGSCFTISSLGGIGGTAFTPIVNAPDVAILGVSKAKMQAVYQDGNFVPRLMLPLSLSYDHRVIDGAEGARFTQALGAYLSDIRQLLL